MDDNIKRIKWWNARPEKSTLDFHQDILHFWLVEDDENHGSNEQSSKKRPITTLTKVRKNLKPIIDVIDTIFPRAN